MANFKILDKNPLPTEKNTHVTWPPSVTEIKTMDSGKRLQVKILWPDGNSYMFDVDEATTV